MPRNRKPAGSYHHGDLRHALLQDALRYIEQHGLAALSLRELARRLGVSPAAPYHHFVDRNALLRELASQGFDGLRAALEAELGRAKDVPLERLAALGRAYVRFAIAQPSYFRLMFRPECVPSLPPPGDPGGPAFSLLQAAVLSCLRAAGRAAEDPLPSIIAMWSGVHGLAMLQLDGPLGKMLGQEEFESLCERVVQVLARALSATAGAIPRKVPLPKRAKTVRLRGKGA